MRGGKDVCKYEAVAEPLQNLSSGVSFPTSNIGSRHWQNLRNTQICSRKREGTVQTKSAIGEHWITSTSCNVCIHNSKTYGHQSHASSHQKLSNYLNLQSISRRRTSSESETPSIPNSSTDSTRQRMMTLYYAQPPEKQTQHSIRTHVWGTGNFFYLTQNKVLKLESSAELLSKQPPKQRLRSHNSSHNNANNINFQPNNNQSFEDLTQTPISQRKYEIPSDGYFQGVQLQRCSEKWKRTLGETWSFSVISQGYRIQRTNNQNLGKFVQYTIIAREPSSRSSLSEVPTNRGYRAKLNTNQRFPVEFLYHARRDHEQINPWMSLTKGFRSMPSL